MSPSSSRTSTSSREQLWHRGRPRRCRAASSTAAGARGRPDQPRDRGPARRRRIPARDFAPTPGRVGRWIDAGGPGRPRRQPRSRRGARAARLRPMSPSSWSSPRTGRTRSTRLRRALDEVEVSGHPDDPAVPSRRRRMTAFRAGDLSTDWVDAMRLATGASSARGARGARSRRRAGRGSSRWRRDGGGRPPTRPSLRKDSATLGRRRRCRGRPRAREAGDRPVAAVSRHRASVVAGRPTGAGARRSSRPTSRATIDAAAGRPTADDRRRASVAARDTAGDSARTARRVRSRSSSTAGGSSSRSRTRRAPRLRERATRDRGRRRRPAARSRSVPSSRAGSSSVAVAPGDAVEAGQPLLVVEAMKMQNELRAPRAGHRRRASPSPPARPSSSATCWSSSSDGRPASTAPRSRPTDDARTPRATAGARRPAARPSPRRRSDGTRSRRRPGSRSGPLHAGGPSPASTRTATSGCPGEYPFTRGVQPTMYRSRFWTMRQYAGFATAEETNRRFRYLLDAGPDRPVGRLRPADPDGLRLRRARGRGRGRPGRRARSRASPTWRRCSTASRSARSRTSMTINATAPILLALYVAAAEQQGVDRASRSAARSRTTSSRSTSPAGRGSTRRAPSMRLVTDVFEFCAPRAAEVEHDLDLRLPHARGRARPPPRSWRSPSPTAIAYVEAAVARGPRRRRLRPPPVVLLRRLVASCSRRSPSSGRRGGCGRGS